MNRRWRGRDSTPPPPGIPKAPSVENRCPGSTSSRPKTGVSSLRRSRSPHLKKSMSPGSKRRVGGGGGGGGAAATAAAFAPKRIPGRREGPLGKRPRINPRNRSKTPPRRSSRERPPPYSPGKDHSGDRSTSKINSSSREDRFRSGDKYLVERPFFRGPEKDIMMDRDSLKKIVVNMRDIPPGSDNIKRDIINPEDITLVRRTVACGGAQFRYGMNEEEINPWENFDDDCNEYPQYYQTDIDGYGPRSSEGSRPIFDRDEIKNYSRKFEDVEESRRVFSGSPPPPRSDRRPGFSPDRLRTRDFYYNNERNSRIREYSSFRPQRDYDSSYERFREERSRYGRSSRSGRSRSRDRRERYEDSRRNRTRGRSSDRSFRRRPSPGDSRRRSDDYRDRSRSPERDDLRHERPPKGKYSSGDYVLEAHGYYEGEAIDGQLALAHRGSGRGLSMRGRGMPNRTLVRPGEIIMRLTPPVRPVRGAFIPRGPAIARRLPFPPRLIRPTGRPVIGVIAPVIPVRPPPVLPVRPHPVVPVRHPVIPLPF